MSCRRRLCVDRFRVRTKLGLETKCELLINSKLYLIYVDGEMMFVVQNLLRTSSRQVGIFPL
jgi:hypothetical protein